MPFENSFISAGIFCQLPPHFQSPFPSVWSLKSCVVFFLPLFSSVLISHRFPCYKQHSYCNSSYFWTNYTFYLLNISTLKFVSCLPFQFIKIIIFCSAETSVPASSYIHPPLIFEHSLQFSMSNNAHVVAFLVFMRYLVSRLKNQHPSDP